MDLGPAVSALLAIVVIDLVLAGDNAVVIALAARALPAHLQKRAIVWGAIGAVAVRSAMTAIVVSLLEVPGLLLAGGALLVWIAYKLLLPEPEASAAHAPAAATFWGAMRTIVVADAVMGLDNVLAVAGAAHGSYLLVVVGLAISVPIVVWGSRLVLKLVDRHPSVVYVGAGVLAWTAVKMIAAEPLLAPWLGAAPALAPLLYLVIPLVLAAGFAKNHRRLESRIHARLADLRERHPAGASMAVPAATAPATDTRPTSTGSPTAAAKSELPGSTREGMPVLKVLVPVDGGANALRAVRHVIAEYQRHHELELHLLNVQPRLSRHLSRFVARGEREAWQLERAEAAMSPAAALLDAAGVPYEAHWAHGDRADAICRAARRIGVQHIVMSTSRKNSLTRMLEDSTTHRVLDATPVPLEIVTGDAVSKWERWGLPAGAIGAGGLLFWAIVG